MRTFSKSLLINAFRFCVPPSDKCPQISSVRFAYSKRYASQGSAKNGWCVPKLRMLVIAQHHGDNTGRGAKSPLTTHWPLDLKCHTYWKQLWVPDWALIQNPKIPMHGSGCTTLGLTHKRYSTATNTTCNKISNQVQYMQPTTVRC